MTLENITVEPSINSTASETTTKDPILDVLTELVETVAELAEKIHELERSIAYSLGER